MRKISFLVFALMLSLILVLGVSATDTSLEADDIGDITGAISAAQAKDTLNIKLIADIEYNTTVTIDKEITVNLEFNGYQLSYTGTAGVGSTTAGFHVNNNGATLNLKGSNHLADYETYTHYDESVKADMVGTATLLPSPTVMLTLIAHTSLLQTTPQ